MPRPISWLPRLHSIRRSITESIRSHYGRKDLERLFELQPRAAQKLLELLPSISLGRARYVERDALNAFLERLQKADDVPAALVQYRKERSAPRRILRELLPRDLPVSRSRFPALECLGHARFCHHPLHQDGRTGRRARLARQHPHR